MRKWFFCLIAILLCLTCAASCGKGPETLTETESETKESSTETELFIPPVIKVLDAKAVDGQVDVTIEMSEHKGLYAADLLLYFNPDVLDYDTFTDKLGEDSVTSAALVEENCVKISFATLKDLAPGQALVTVSFRIRTGAASGTYAMELYAPEASGRNAQEIEIVPVDGSVTIP